MEPNYYITPVNHAVFDNADPDKKKEFCLLGVHISLIMPKTEYVLRDEHNDTRLKQKEVTINHLEEELRTVREKHTEERDTGYNMMRKIYDAAYLRVESLNIKLKEENERLLFGRDTYVREQVDRTVDFYKEQLNQEKRTVEFQQDFTSGLEQLIDGVKTCLNAATQNQLRTPETQKVCAYLEACNALLLRLRAP